ncbi:MAG: PDZ domain-containing protein [Fibromonadaceae bacterium]|jgi:membrane-associated protease RseP (regulator of RpoE activity)|nr:PDZ domain-containing protein [Fibromonadaceae bacterium]
MKKVLKFLFVAAILANVAVAVESENFGGLGISVWAGKSGVRVAGVLPNSPAENIGLTAGDLILSVNGTELSSIEPTLQVSYLRGEAGSVASLVVERNGEKISLSAKRVNISVQNLDASDISAWYGKNSGLTEEEISHLASQKTGESYEFLGIMQYGMPIAKHTENLNLKAIQHVSVKKTEEHEAKQVNSEGFTNADAIVLNGQKDLLLVNAKGARTKKQNLPLYMLSKNGLPKTVRVRD